MSSHSTEKKDPFHIEYKRAPLTKRNLERYNDQAKSKEYIDKVAALAVDLIYDSAGNEIDVRKDIQKLLQVHRVRSVAVDEGLLDGLANAIRDDRVQGLFMQDALDFIMEALSETIEFEFKRYPEIFAMILAFGVSVLIDDGMTVRAIGFGETGPVKDTTAADWLAECGKHVPYNSLISYFEKLGMFWWPREADHLHEQTTSIEPSEYFSDTAICVRLKVLEKDESKSV